MGIKRRAVLPLLLAAVAAGACGDISGNPTTSLTIKLTDAPGDVAEAWVEITEIYLQGSADGGGGRVTLFQGSTGLIDLLTLSGGATVDLVKDATVPAGRYSQLRFRIGEARIVTEGGTVFSTENGNLLCPSCSSPSGLKVKLPGGSVRIDGDAQVVVVDFDVSQSFGSERGNSNRWVMHPVMYASDFQTSGAIAGTVALDDGVEIPECGEQVNSLAQFVPTATAGDVVRSGVTNEAGAYSISWLAPGTYQLGVAPVEFQNGESLVFTATATPSSVSVSGSGQTAQADYLVTAVSCESS